MLLKNNDNGFFMMVGGGKIDWACHANDSVSTMCYTQAFLHILKINKFVHWKSHHQVQCLRCDFILHKFSIEMILDFTLSAV